MGSVAILAQESEDQSFLCAMIAFSKLSVMVAAPAAANQLFAAPAPFAAAPQVATVMGPTTGTVAEPVLFLQPTQERETNGSWASAGALCAGAAVAAGAVSLAAAQTKSAVQTPSRREQRAALRAARNASLEMTVTADASTAGRSGSVQMFSEGDIGVLPPLGVYDPLGLIETRDMRRYEIMEIKHGRAAMLGFLHVIAIEAGVR